MNRIDRKFRIYGEDEFYKSLKAAKAVPISGKKIERVWLIDGEVIGRYTIFTCGESVCTIHYADQIIYQRLKLERIDFYRG